MKWLDYSSDGIAVARGWTTLKRAGVDFGPLPRIRGRLKVTNHGKMRFGARLLIESELYAGQIFTNPTGIIEMGDYVYINQGVNIRSSTHISIGDRVLLGPRVTLVDSSAHDLAPNLPKRAAPIHIESDAWLGRGCLILPGVTIGRYSVVGSEAVVSRDVPDRVVVAGVPARIVRELDIPDGWERT